MTATDTIVLAGGGTGGHLIPAMALAEAAAAGGLTPVLITGDRPIETRVLKDAPWARRTLNVQGFATAGWRGKLKALVQVLPATLRAWRWLGQLRPRWVVLTGGYVALPVGLAARLRGCRIALVEPNAIAGRTTRLLMRFARAVVALNEDLPHPERTALIRGLPVRAAIRNANAARSAGDELVRVLVIGGSQGAAALNRVVPQVLGRFEGLAVQHATGPGRQDEVAGAYGPIAAEVVEYIDDMAAAYAQADFAIARAGAATTGELLAAGVPAILVPYPTAADDHQTRNGEIFIAAGGGLIVAEGDGFAERLETAVRYMHEPVTRGRHAAALAEGSDRYDPAAILATLDNLHDYEGDA